MDREELTHRVIVLDYLKDAQKTSKTPDLYKKAIKSLRWDTILHYRKQLKERVHNATISNGI